LKTFVTQIEPALPLTSDPPVKCFWNWIRWKYYEVPKDRNLESVSAKNRTFFSPTALLPTLPRQAHTHPADGPVHVSRFFRRDLHGKGEVSVATRGRRGPLSAAARRRRVPPLSMDQQVEARMAGRSRRRRWRAGEGRSGAPCRPPPGSGDGAGEVLWDPTARRRTEAAGRRPPRSPSAPLIWRRHKLPATERTVEEGWVARSFIVVTCGCSELGRERWSSRKGGAGTAPPPQSHTSSLR
jgi:hypothetical protein